MVLYPFQKHMEIPVKNNIYTFVDINIDASKMIMGIFSYQYLKNGRLMIGLLKFFENFLNPFVIGNHCILISGPPFSNRSSSNL